MRLGLVLLAVVAAGAIVAAGNRYEIVAAPSAQPAATWRLDRWTGKVALCTGYPLTIGARCDPAVDFTQ